MEIKKNLQILSKLFWKQCCIPACILNIVIEMCSRESFVEPFWYAITNPLVFLYNTFIIAVTLLPCLFVKRKRFVHTTLCVLWGLIGFTDFVLLQFRTTPFTFVDIFLIDTALAMIPHYLTVWQIISIIIVLGGASVVCIYLFLHTEKVKREVPVWIGIGFCSIALFGLIGITELGKQTNLLERNFGNIAQSFHKNGLPYCFMNSVFGMGIDEPKKYSEEIIDQIIELLEIDNEVWADSVITKEEIPSPTIFVPSATPVPEQEENSSPNVLFLQLESFFDPLSIKGIQFSSDPVPVFRELKENFTSGFLRVPSFGAGTANTEFEILTGMNLDFFGPGEYPYKTVLKDTSCESIAFNLSALGLVPHAIHNNDATFYGRNHVFSQLGFVTFTAIEYMSDYEKTPLGWAKDACLVEEILHTLQSTEEKDFIYTISVQAHGSYPSEPILKNPVIDVTLPEELEELYYEWLYYSNQLYEVDLFLKQLIEQLEAYPEDVVLVLYGDHLPTFPLSNEMMEHDSIYETEYVIWSNFSMEQENVDLEAYQLSAYVLKRLGIQEGLLTKYHQMQKEAEDYLSHLEILEYDMLYGTMDCYNGKNPYQPTELQLGIDKITIDSVVVRENVPENGRMLLYVTGNHFTEYSVVYVNEEALETIYIDSHTLAVSDEKPEEILEITVKQVGKDKEELTVSNIYFYH